MGASVTADPNHNGLVRPVSSAVVYFSAGNSAGCTPGECTNAPEFSMGPVIGAFVQSVSYFQQPWRAHVSSDSSNNWSTGLVLALDSSAGATHSATRGYGLLCAQRAVGEPSGHRPQRQCSSCLQRPVAPARGRGTCWRLLRVDALPGRPSEGAAVGRLSSSPSRLCGSPLARTSVSCLRPGFGRGAFYNGDA